MFTRPPLPSQHKRPLCGHTVTLCESIPSDDQSTISPMFIKGLPLYGYLLTVNTPIFAFFLARCNNPPQLIWAGI